MSFKDVLAKVELDTETTQMKKAVHKNNMSHSKMERYEERAFLHEVRSEDLADSNVQTVIDISLNTKDGERITIHTNQMEAYFDDCTGKMVFLSGLLKKDPILPVLYVTSCYSIDERDSALNNCKDMTEEEKRTFYKKIREFSPELQRDLTEKRVALVGRVDETLKKEMLPATYIDLEEMDALYDVLEPMIPIEFRTEYSNCKRMLKKPGANSEKRNYIKVINNILTIDWENQYYKEIDVDTATEKMKQQHIGHEVQIEELRTQLLICNLTKKAPKTLSFIGRSCGCGSLAAELAKAIGRKYVEIDFSGRNTKDSDTLTGSSRIYENGKCGLIFEKMVDVGPYGCLIIKNIDTYDAGTLDIITSLIEKEVYTDNFMEIAMDLSNLWIITTASSTKNIPMSLRKSTHEILFEKMTESERIEAINKVIFPQKCKEYGIVCDTAIPTDTCKTLIYQLSHNENKKIEMNIEALVVKVLAEGKKEFPIINKELLKQYFHYDDDIEKIQGEYVTDLAAMENKFYHLYDYYPTPVRDRVSELLEDIRYSDDDKLEAYSIHALRYLVNPTNGTPFEYEIGVFENEIKRMRSGQDSLIHQVDDALLAEKLSGNNKRMTVLGLWGPPGVGKTSVAEIIAKALKRNLIKISFGGAHDSSIIKGKNKVVQNAGPSLLLSELARKCGTYHDVINIDEVDKGNPESYDALHEFLDPATECYFEEFPETNIPKNNFLVILTFNDITKIPNPILDRIRLIKVDGYTISEKSSIANSVIEKFESRMGLKNVTITDDAISLLMHEYSVAPGIRDLEMDIEKLIVQLYKRDLNLDNIQITANDVREVLGCKRTIGLNDMGNKTAVPGQAIALAISGGNMGSCIAIQVVEDPYQAGDLEISGLMKGSCLESLSDAMSYARRTLKKELPKLHISFRDPAVQKDGASAGVTLYMALMSCLLNKPLEGCAFTGTIDAFGNVGIVGVNEKLTAAEREGIKCVYIPQDNYDQLKENHMLEKYNKIEIIPVKHVNELTKKFFGLEAE